MSGSMPDEAQARYAWEELKDWLASTPDGQLVLAEYRKSPEKRRPVLASWLHSHVNQTPPQLATYVQGGQVDNLVNVAHAGVVYFDASGAGHFIFARGLARFFFILGGALGLAAFVCFGYTVVKAFSTFNSGLDEAERRCRRLHPPNSFELANCLSQANAMYGGFDFEPTPWIPLAAVLGFAALVASFLGTILVRRPGR
jgi:hypothetical protein